MFTAVGAVAPTAAHADRCEPEELVLGADTSPIDERDNPACTVLFNYVYPFVCEGDTPGEQPSDTILVCAQNLRLNPTYVPPLIPPYSPDFGRLTCNLIKFASPSATCLFTANPTTGDINIMSSLGSITIPTAPASGASA